MPAVLPSSVEPPSAMRVPSVRGSAHSRSCSTATSTPSMYISTEHGCSSESVWW